MVDIRLNYMEQGSESSLRLQMPEDGS